MLANGRGAAVDQTSALARAPYIAVAELTGTAAQGRILLAAPITQAEIELHFADQIETADEISFDRGAMALRARRKKTLHAITLSEAPLALTALGGNRAGAGRWADRGRPRQIAVVEAGQAMARPRDVPAQGRRRRVRKSWPDLSDDALAAQREAWLVPALYDKTSLKDFSAGDLSDALMTLLPWELRARLEREAPTHFEAPTGTQLAIDYEAEQGPTIAVRLQELFGLNTHPSIAKGTIPLVLELLSPAHRPVQVTRDLPGFWRGSYAAVRSDLRGRYPAASLAGGSRERDADPPGQAAGDVRSTCSHSPPHRRERLRARPLTLRSSFSPKWQPAPTAVGRSLAADVVISRGSFDRVWRHA